MRELTFRTAFISFTFYMFYDIYVISVHNAFRYRKIIDSGRLRTVTSDTGSNGSNV